MQNARSHSWIAAKLFLVSVDIAKVEVVNVERMYT
jgi:hypothetical protein